MVNKDQINETKKRNSKRERERGKEREVGAGIPFSSFH